ncbi:MAG: hypothetical protein ACOCRK_10035 [bacterium]
MINKEIAIDIDDFKKIKYFIISKFEYDALHIQGTSSKSDLLGGFIDRWINKISESIIFNKLLLRGKNYKAVIDYFIYTNDAEKNAPDVLGLKKSQGEIIKFADFHENTWRKRVEMPYIEVKTFRENQKLCSIRDSQMKDDHFYIIVKSKFNPNYLKCLFDEDCFNQIILQELLMEEEFINSNSQNILKQLNSVEKETEVGSIRLIGVYKGVDLKEYSALCPSGESPIYLKEVIPRENMVRGANKNHNFTINDNKLYKKMDIFL